MMKENPFLHLEDIIYQALRMEIIGLRIAPGSKLNESKIAEDLGVSRTPVRNALARLVEEGYAAYLAASLITEKELEEFFIIETRCIMR